MTNQKRSTDRYLKLHAQGLTNIEIARKCGVSPSAVTRYFQDNGITRNGIRRHSKHERALRRAEKRKLTYRQAAKEMGLSPRYVSAICKRLGIKLVDGRGARNNRAKGGARELPKVKTLEWVDWVSGHRTNSQAITPFGTYTLLHKFFRDEHWQWIGPDDTAGRGETIAAAKAAAQADFERRILSALAL